MTCSKSYTKLVNMADKLQPFLIDTQEIKIAADVVVLAYNGSELHSLLIQRQYPPDEGKWALPGGFIKNDEELLDAVNRVIKDETGLKQPEFIHEIGTFGSVYRDPRRRVVSIAYLLLTNELGQVSGQVKDYQATKDAKWLALSDVPEDLAFDHESILATARKQLANLVMTDNLAKWLMPGRFTLTELQKLYEQVLGIKLEKRNFRKNINQRKLLVELDDKQTGNHRPARLYKFK